MAFWRRRCASVVGALALCAAASAQIVNGGFEQSGGSFSSWTTRGDTLIQTASLGTGPTQGIYDALLATATDGTVNPNVPAGSGVGAAVLETALGVTGGTLAGVGNGSPVLGSVVVQTFTIQAGQTLSFDWNFLTNQTYNDGTSFSYAPSTANNDFAFVTLVPSGAQPQITKLADTFYGYVNNPGAPGGFETGFTLTAVTNPFVSQTGFHAYSWVAPSSGQFTLGVGVVHVTNGPDNGINSAVLVDNVSIVPEPVTALALAPMVLIAVRRRKGRG